MMGMEIPVINPRGYRNIVNNSNLYELTNDIYLYEIFSFMSVMGIGSRSHILIHDMFILYIYIYIQLDIVRMYYVNKIGARG